MIWTSNANYHKFWTGEWFSITSCYIDFTLSAHISNLLSSCAGGLMKCLDLSQNIVLDIHINARAKHGLSSSFVRGPYCFTLFNFLKHLKPDLLLLTQFGSITLFFCINWFLLFSKPFIFLYSFWIVQLHWLLIELHADGRCVQCMWSQQLCNTTMELLTCLFAYLNRFCFFFFFFFFFLKKNSLKSFLSS